MERIVRHCLEKNPEERFHSAHDVAFALEALSDASTPAPALAGLRARARPRARALVWATGLAAALATVAAAVLWLRAGARTIDSVAVLPFVNAGGDPNAEYLSDGITESLINNEGTLSRSVRSWWTLARIRTFGGRSTTRDSRTSSPCRKRLPGTSPGSFGSA